MKDAEGLEELDGEVAVAPGSREPRSLVDLSRGPGDGLGWVGGMLALRAGTGRSTASRLPFPIPACARGWFVPCHGTRTFAQHVKAVKALAWYSAGRRSPSSRSRRLCSVFGVHCRHQVFILKTAEVVVASMHAMAKQVGLQPQGRRGLSHVRMAAVDLQPQGRGAPNVSSSIFNLKTAEVYFGSAEVTRLRVIDRCQPTRLRSTRVSAMPIFTLKIVEVVRAAQHVAVYQTSDVDLQPQDRRGCKQPSVAQPEMASQRRSSASRSRRLLGRRGRRQGGRQRPVDLQPQDRGGC